MGNLRRHRRLPPGGLKTRCEYAHARTAVITIEVFGFVPAWESDLLKGVTIPKNPQDTPESPGGS
ncbi:hypothetical protein R1CP_40340 (plasmid) [Rhodococcus opacus]|uniref:Uncharacterized protein n=1 Tax=Rhodococcus opacus TaxID=37919 RepID=A0A1B1KJ64_RHOOP|nr:hypothetical protein R1CP_40340 [Rhodococcus opacus]